MQNKEDRLRDGEARLLVLVDRVREEGRINKEETMRLKGWEARLAAAEAELFGREEALLKRDLLDLGELLEKSKWQPQ